MPYFPLRLVTPVVRSNFMRPEMVDAARIEPHDYVAVNVYVTDLAANPRLDVRPLLTRHEQRV